MSPWRRGAERGATAVEYGLLLAFIAAVIVAAVTITGTKVLAMFQSAIW
ncbi:Flp family type IVb pilin [Knoellia sp. p5-6-4]|nr:Flp family type IVb pilin [Knoellia sp. p5-6-4]MDF2146414.1 Flp family type IVb pilin [Knoellia sp. p5-6-4]